MEHSAIIAGLLDEVRKEEIDFLLLKEALNHFKALLVRLTEIDLMEAKNRQDLHFDNGMALNTSFAILCIDDIMRTRQFLRGIDQAIEAVYQQKEGPVKILYAGTGPFATLVLPFITQYTAAELQLILVDTNPTTLAYLKTLVKELSIGDYIEQILCVDASKHQFKEELDIDILISETMQQGLVKEQQVPILFNLVQQLPREVIIIPHKIQLDLALMSSSFHFFLEEDPSLKYQKLKHLLDFDQSFIRSYIAANPSWEEKLQFDLCNQVFFGERADHDKLVILTFIQVFEEEYINYDLSSLTIPKVLIDFEELEVEEKEISISYVVKEIPDFEFELN
ncbi:MAG: hypothetical protein AAFP19_15260 [Bacteroidota bacterium]